MSNSKYSVWTYVLQLDEKVVGAFSSAALAYGHWLVYAERFSSPDSPFCHCSRFRVRLEPYDMQQQDMTLFFARQWQAIRDQKKKTSEQ